MKHTITLLLLVMAVLTPGQAQKNGVGQGTEATKQALINLENKWVDALTKADTATLDSILVDTYVDTDEHSHRSDKQGVLSVLKSGELKMESIKLSDMQVYVYGDAAVVTGSASQAGNFKGQPLTSAITLAILSSDKMESGKQLRRIALGCEASGAGVQRSPRQARGRLFVGSLRLCRGLRCLRMTGWSRNGWASALVCRERETFPGLDETWGTLGGRMGRKVWACPTYRTR